MPTCLTHSALLLPLLLPPWPAQSARAVFSLAYPFHYDFTASAEGSLVLSGGTLLSYAHGAFSADQLLDAVEIGQEACKRIARFQRLALVRSLQAAA